MKTNSQLYADVMDSLAWHGMVPHEKIKISVERGRITLSGEVEWRFQMKNAEAAVRSVMGVKEVNNHIKVRSLLSSKEVVNKISRFQEALQGAWAAFSVVEVDERCKTVY